MHTYSLECENCFSFCEITFDFAIPDRIHCPLCREPHDSNPDFDELDFDA
jgi:hypothetical protein